MPIDASIALQGKLPQIQTPNELMANAYNMQNAQQANQLNMMKMDEYKRGLAEQNQFKNALSQANDDISIRNAFYAKGDVKGYQDYLKGNEERAKLKAETTNLGYTGQKTQVEAAAKKQEMIQSMLRDLSTRPSDANIIAHAEDIAASPLFTPEEKAAVKRRTADLLAKPMDQRVPDLASAGASASDLKPNIQMQNLGGTSNVLSIPAFGGAPTVLSSNKMTATPGDVMSRDTQRRGQDLTNARELQRIEIEKGKNSPEYIAMEARMKEQGKGQAKFEATAPQAIATAEQMLTKIDDMVGKPAKLNAKGQVVEKGTAAHPGFKGAVGKSSMYPLIPGTDAANFQARLDEIKGGAFLEAYNTLRGGGSITQIEGDKATAARTRMSTAQSEEEFIAAARDYQNIIRAGIKDAKEKLTKGTTANPNVDALLEKYKER
jgi:hypothetical protein